ncbi:MAG: hypothetical protein KJ718_00430 [Nanoarchaeota archaeon]|nr:hypothetical protein [Nanoarchaeota archaeon]MBU1051007.1 hypothetical protein [Nanoarchaeota archaeon]MBU1989048.1 hypothetical protein [Nanoarchaeota archaeon]
MAIPQARTQSPVELFDEHKLFEVIKKEIRRYYSDVYDAEQLIVLDARLSRATLDTTFASLIQGFGGDDALGLRYHLAHRLDVAENDLPRPHESDLKRYNLGNAVHAFRCAAGLE